MTTIRRRTVSDRDRLDRAVLAIGLLALAAVVLSPLGYARLRGAGLVVTVVLGLLAVAAGWLARRPLALAAGIGFLAAAALQIAQLGGRPSAVEHGILDGNASTFALWLGLGVGLLALGLTGSGSGGARTE